MSDPQGTPEGNRIPNELPAAANYDRFDKYVIIGTIAFFAALFLLLTWLSNQQLYQYWSFAALLTVVFVGVLKATGIIRIAWLAMGGSVVVFVGLIWYTTDAYEKFYEYNKAKTDYEQKLKLRDEEIEKLTKYRNQDLAISTRDARTLRPLNSVRFTYALRNNTEHPAKKGRGDNLHIIPASALPDLTAIYLEFSLLDARPDRPGATSASPKFEIERMRIEKQPLMLELHVRQEDH